MIIEDMKLLTIANRFAIYILIKIGGCKIEKDDITRIRMARIF